jgi:transcription factor HY5
MDSDEDIGRVPEFRLDQGGPSTSGREPAVAGTSSEPAQSAAAAQATSRRRGRSPADKEHRRLKRYCTLNDPTVSS